MNKDEKRALWMERIQEFQSSGQTCKSWCQNNQIAVSTMNYWIRQLRDRKLQSESDMIFAKMPSEQELSMKESFNSMAPSAFGLQTVSGLKSCRIVRRNCFTPLSEV